MGIDVANGESFTVFLNHTIRPDGSETMTVVGWERQRLSEILTGVDLSKMKDVTPRV